MKDKEKDVLNLSTIEESLDQIELDDLREERMRNHIQTLVGNKSVIVQKDDMSKIYLEKDFINHYKRLTYVTEETKEVKSKGKTYTVVDEVERMLVTKFLNQEIEIYENIVFKPTSKVDKLTYNIWKGWGVSPVNGDCSKFLNHLKENICNSDENLYEYFLDWMAHLVQKPEVKAYIPALVLRGNQGSGKGTFVSYLSGILDQSAFGHLTSKETFFNNFNSELSNKLLVFADEITWAGNHQEAAKLKTFISETSQRIEFKGKDAIYQDNFARLIISSNSDWVAPVEKGDRRYVVTDVPYKGQPTDYFKSIIQEGESGGYSALLYLLQNRDISKRDWSKKPKSVAKSNQRMETFNSFETWLMEQLTDDLNSENNLFKEAGISEFKLFSKVAYENYKEWFTSVRRRGDIFSSIKFSKLLTEVTGNTSVKSNGSVYRLVPVDIKDRFIEWTEIISLDDDEYQDELFEKELLEELSGDGEIDP